MTGNFEPIISATPVFRADGTLYSPQFGDIYASAEGTLAETRHVFLDGNELPGRWNRSGNFTIVETGFGAGLNFLATWQSWRECAPAQARLHFVSVEKHPFLRADLVRVHERFPGLEALARALHDGYPLPLPGFHRLHLDQGRVTLTLLFGEASVMLHQLDAGADAFFLDGFAPARNPQMWSDAVFAELARLARPAATIATYTVAGAVRQGLAAAGFTVEKRAGFARKREMLAGRFRGEATAQVPSQKRAAVIGAGLAGTACAQRLAERGWTVDVIERHTAPALETSGNPAGLVRPVLSLDWNTHSRFSSAAFQYAMRHQSTLVQAGGALIQGTGGVLQLARDTGHFEKQQHIVERFALPGELVQMTQKRQAEDLAGAAVAGGGWWFPGAAWVNPVSVCQSNLHVAGQRICGLFGSEAAALRRTDLGWEVLDPRGQILSSAAVVILANAHFAGRLSQAAGLPLRLVRGQLSLVPARRNRPLRIAVCKEGYMMPAVDGTHCLGASFNEGMIEESVRLEDHAANLQRLERMLPDFGTGLVPENLDGRVAFRTMSADRLPVLGALPAQDGLFACLALGSRGMTWAALAAEIVASRICGEPMPVERDLLDALDPGRFGKKRGARPGAW